MKLKYYLRGIGVGILFSTIILAVSFHATKKTQLSDAEIIERAEELGMVNKEEVEMSDLVAPSTTPIADSSGNSSMESTGSQEETTTEEMTTEETTEEMTTEQAVTSVPEQEEEPSITPTPKSSKEQGEEQTRDKSNSTDNMSTETSTANKDEANKTFVSFEILAGMSSEDVANLLKDKGVVEDSKAFNQYLKQNKYTTDINIGKYEVEKYASYEDIADAIIKSK